MNQEAATKLARMTALEAVKEFQKAEVKKKRVRIFQNTKKLMENYNRICQAVEEGIAELSEVPTEEDIEEYNPDDIVVDSILKSKLRSIVMLAHIDRCLKLLEDEQYRKDTHEKYLAFTYFYLDGMSHESVAEVLGCVDRTSRRWITEMTNILGVYLFGVDALILT